MLRNVLRLAMAFYISCLAYTALVEQKIFRRDIIWEILTLRRYPGWSEFLASFGAVLLAGAVLFPLMRRMNGKAFAAMAGAGLLACFLPYQNVTNSWAALFWGSDSYITFPVLRYWGYFAAGVWCAKEKKRPGPKGFLAVLALGIPCGLWYRKTGFLPERFPPSALFVAGGAAGVFLYWLGARAIAACQNGRAAGGLCRRLSLVGKNSLWYLLMSNVFIFAVAGSKFSYRDNGYAYGFFLVLLAVLWYLERQIKK